MNCGRFQKMIDSYLDSRLSGSLLAEFHAHRLNCRHCSRLVSMLQAAGDVIAQDHCEPKIRLDFADRLLAAMPTARKTDRSLWLVRLTAGAAGLAAAAAIMIAALLPAQAPVPHGTAIAGKVVVAPDTDIQIPQGSQNVVQMVQHIPADPQHDASHTGTLLDGKVVRDAVDRMVWWYEADRKGQ